MPDRILPVLPQHQRRGLLVILAGPSGSGKSTLLDGLLKSEPDFAASVSATTRKPRPGERDGVDYHFLSEDRFRDLIAADGFLEYAQVFAKDWYGTPRAFVEDRLASGRSVITDIDVQGAAQIRGRMPQAVQVFVTPPSVPELERRLRGRGTESAEAIARRLDEAGRELARAQEFQYLIINDDMQRALDDLRHIIAAERLRLVR